MANDVSDAVVFEAATKRFAALGGDVAAVAGVTGRVATGTTLTIIGPSGSGKSTLLALVNLLITPDSGSVQVAGREVREWEITALRTHVGMVFQSPTMLPGTVEDNILAGCCLRGVAPALDPGDLLKALGLDTELLTRPAADLSGGQMQRVALARTLTNGPKILLLDEVTSALDPPSVEAIEGFLHRLSLERRFTILWVTHHLEQARRMGDQTWFMQGGRLLEAKDTRTMFSCPETPEARAFLGQGPEEEGMR